MRALLVLSSALACSPPALGALHNPDSRPNILFAISDDQSFAHTGFGDCKFVRTPAFDRIARSGVFFTNCYAGSPGCAPSRGSIVTGRYHWQNEQSGQHASSWMKKYVPFTDKIAADGYYTGRTGKGVSPFQYARSEADSLWRRGDAAGIERSRVSYAKGSDGDERFTDGIGLTNYFENFRYFLENRPENCPFFFWYGATEPHRNYEKDSWKRHGKNPEDAAVPAFLPDNDIIRGDMLDYAVEIEWFDLHLDRMLNYLEEIGELENTIVIVTSDNGIPFPGAKANCFEYGVHVPLAISCPGKFPGGRTVDDPVSFIDFAPTILEMTGTKPGIMQPISGESLLPVLESNENGITGKHGKFVCAGRERHSSSRYNNWGYPQRTIRTTDFLLIWNLRPATAPAGDPQSFKPGTGELSPLYGIDNNGKHNPEMAFTDVDASISKSFIVEFNDDDSIKPYFDRLFGKRPEYELYNIKSDPFCLNNISGRQEYEALEKELKQLLLAELARTEDPRVTGPDREIFDSYERYSPMRSFPKPEQNR